MPLSGLRGAVRAPTSRWLVYPVALAVGVGAGLIAHSGLVAGAAALLFAVIWIGLRGQG